MPTIQIGRAAILYDLRRSPACSERRIVVTPGHVEVTALTTDSEADIDGFLSRKRQWLFDTVREMQRATASRHSVPRFMTGSKIPYRGRNMALTVRRSDAERMQISYRNGFLVDLPIWAEGDTDHLVASELKLWLKQRARYDVQQAAAKFSRQFGLTPRSIRVADLAHGWGSCGQEDNVVVNWQLIFAPSRVLEYVVAHELAHLRHRNHEPAFWTYLEGIAPGWRSAKAWLDQHEGSLSADFLAIRTDRPEPVTA